MDIVATSNPLQHITSSEAQSLPSGSHPKYWLYDGSIIITILDEQNRDVHFKLSRSDIGKRGVPTMTIPPKLGVKVQDFVSLLEHLYNDAPLSSHTPFSHVAGVLRVTSPSQLDLPHVHGLARGFLEAMFPSGPFPFVHPNCLEDALTLATQHGAPSIRKGIYYSLVTTVNFEMEVPPSKANLLEPHPKNSAQDEPASDVMLSGILPPVDIEKCRSLMAGLVDHLTPILFTPPTTPHISCTDVFANAWMGRVIQPAFSDGGVYKPLETLEKMKQVDWAAEGLCPDCIGEKREEWTNEQKGVWEKVDGWLAFNSS